MKKGFIYITTNNITNTKYIGKKYYFYKNGKESNWKDYLGSSKKLKEDIAYYGKENFSKEIIAEANTAEELATLEKFYIDSYNAVFSQEYYNLSNNVDKFFTTKDSTKRMLETRSNWSEEKRQSISKKLKERWSKLSSEERLTRISRMSKPRNEKFSETRSKIQKNVWASYSNDEKRSIAIKRSAINKAYWNNLTEYQKAEHLNLRMHAIAKMNKRRMEKAFERQQQKINLVNIKTNEILQMTIENVRKFLNIPSSSLSALINGKYGKFNIYKKIWTIKN